MLKKIILATLLIGFTGALVWGGVNRTLAKTNESDGRNANNQNSEHIENEDGNGVQQRGNGNQGQGNSINNQSDGDQPHENINEQMEPVSQGQGKGNGFQVDPVIENAAASTDSSSNSNGVNSENQAQGNGNRGGRGNGNGNGQGGGNNPLTETEIKALNMALNDEYHALAVYQSVIATFGEVEPFVEIAVSEQRHIDALINQFNKQGLPIPESLWVGNIPPFESVQQACQAGVEAEIANADLYNQLFSMIDNPTLTRVFTNLSNASLNSHLPQFETCQ